MLKSFSQAKTFIFVDEKELSSGREWIISHQRKDGSFPQLGRLINKDIQGGLYGRVSLTAYVLTALLESGSNEKVVCTFIIEIVEVECEDESTQKHIYTHIHTFIHTYIHICMYVCLYVCLYVCFGVLSFN